MSKDMIPNWVPLERHIGKACAMWMWMYRERGLEYYKHIHTRKYLILDPDGTAFRLRQDGGLIQSDFEREYQRATERTRP